MLAWQRMATEGCALHHDNPRKKRLLWSLPSWFDQSLVYFTGTSSSAGKDPLVINNKHF
jgi:hypothetical protein